MLKPRFRIQETKRRIKVPLPTKAKTIQLNLNNTLTVEPVASMEDWALNGTGDTGAERQRGVKPKLQKSEELGYLGRFGTAHNSITAYRFTYPAPDMIWYHASLLYWPVTRPYDFLLFWSVDLPAHFSSDLLSFGSFRPAVSCKPTVFTTNFSFFFFVGLILWKSTSYQTQHC